MVKYLKPPPPRLPPRRMSASEFEAWMKRVDLNITHAALALGVTRGSINRWRISGAPPLVRLATESVRP